MCWSTTEAFHELYQRCKTMQEKYFNPVIKIEIDTTGLYQENNDRDFHGEQPFDMSVIKVEPNLGEINEINFLMP